MAHNGRLESGFFSVARTHARGKPVDRLMRHRAPWRRGRIAVLAGARLGLKLTGADTEVEALRTASPSSDRSAVRVLPSRLSQLVLMPAALARSGRHRGQNLVGASEGEVFGREI